MSNRKKKVYTLCMVLENDNLLLGYKKIGYGAGLWNGFGGSVEKGETVEHAASRELQEECHLTSNKLEKSGVLRVTFDEGPKEEHEIHIFSAKEIKGEPKETNEMRPQWFSIDQIPYDNMWPEDTYWLPRLLEGKPISGRCHYKDMKTISWFKFNEKET